MTPSYELKKVNNNFLGSFRQIWGVGTLEIQKKKNGSQKIVLGHVDMEIFEIIKVIGTLESISFILRLTLSQTTNFRPFRTERMCR